MPDTRNFLRDLEQYLQGHTDIEWVGIRGTEIILIKFKENK